MVDFSRQRATKTLGRERPPLMSDRDRAMHHAFMNVVDYEAWCPGERSSPTWRQKATVFSEESVNRREQGLEKNLA